MQPLCQYHNIFSIVPQKLMTCLNSFHYTQDTEAFGEGVISWNLLRIKYQMSGPVSQSHFPKWTINVPLNHHPTHTDRRKEYIPF